MVQSKIAEKFLVFQVIAFELVIVIVNSPFYYENIRR